MSHRYRSALQMTKVYLPIASIGPEVPIVILPYATMARDASSASATVSSVAFCRHCLAPSIPSWANCALCPAREYGRVLCSPAIAWCIYELLLSPDTFRVIFRLASATGVISPRCQSRRRIRRYGAAQGGNSQCIMHPCRGC